MALNAWMAPLRYMVCVSQKVRRPELSVNAASMTGDVDVIVG